MDRRAQRFIHHKSQFHRLFILPGRPTSEAGPIKFSHSCPSACHLTHISPNTPSFSPFVSRYSPHVPFILILSLAPLTPAAPSLLLTSNEERTRLENYEVAEARKSKAHSGAGSIRKREDVQCLLNKAASVYQGYCLFFF